MHLPVVMKRFPRHLSLPGPQHLRQHPLYDLAQVPNGVVKRGGTSGGKHHEGEGGIRILDEVKSCLFSTFTRFNPPLSNALLWYLLFWYLGCANWQLFICGKIRHYDRDRVHL